MESVYRDIYEFAASAGALEGYVYQKETMDPGGLDNWIRNLQQQYQALPTTVRQSFQDSLDRTVGRAVQSLIALFGEDHAHVAALKTLIQGKMPGAANDFEKEKEEKSAKYSQ